MDELFLDYPCSPIQEKLNGIARWRFLISYTRKKKRKIRKSTYPAPTKLSPWNHDFGFSSIRGGRHFDWILAAFALTSTDTKARILHPCLSLRIASFSRSEPTQEDTVMVRILLNEIVIYKRRLGISYSPAVAVVFIGVVFLMFRPTPSPLSILPGA